MKTKNFLLIAATLMILGLAVGVYLYNKPYKRMEQLTPTYSVSAIELFQTFQTNENDANKKYLDQVIEVTGNVKNITQNEEGYTTITLDVKDLLAGVVCEMDYVYKTNYDIVKAGDEVKVRGVCSGMLMDVILVRCILNN